MRVGVFPGTDLAQASGDIEDCIAKAAGTDAFLANNPPEVVWDGFQAEGYVLEEGSDAEAVLADSHRHVFGERVNLDSCRQVTRAIARFIADWCGLELL